MKEFEGMGNGEHDCWITDRELVENSRAFRVAGERSQLRFKVGVNSKRSTLLLTFFLVRNDSPFSLSKAHLSHITNNTNTNVRITLHKLYDSHP